MTVPAPDLEVRTGQSVLIVVRPEMVEIDHPEAQLEGTVRLANYLGDVIEYDVEVGGQLLALVEKDPRHTTIHPEGESVRLHFLEDCLYVLPEYVRIPWPGLLDPAGTAVVDCGARCCCPSVCACG